MKEHIAEAEVQTILLGQKINFEEEREMRKAITNFEERRREEEKDIIKLEKEVAWR